MFQVFRGNITSSINYDVAKIASSLLGMLSALNKILGCNIENNNLQEKKKEAISKEHVWLFFLICVHQLHKLVARILLNTTVHCLF